MQFNIDYESDSIEWDHFCVMPTSFSLNWQSAPFLRHFQMKKKYFTQLSTYAFELKTKFNECRWSSFFKLLFYHTYQLLFFTKFCLLIFYVPKCYLPYELRCTHLFATYCFILLGVFFGAENVCNQVFLFVFCFLKFLASSSNRTVPSRHSVNSTNVHF